MISIIVLVYNTEKYLKRCLDSLLSQTIEDIEIICVNDGSTDTSGTILSDYANLDSRIRVITQCNKGMCATRNRGIEEARGEWFMIVDSDDWIDSDTCETAIKAAIDNNADLVFWPYVREYEDGRSAPRLLLEKDCEFEGENLRLLHRRIVGPVGKELSNPALLYSWGTSWGKLYKRKLIGTTKFIDTQIVGSSEDALFNAEIFNRLKKVVYINKTMNHYRKQSTSFTGGYNNMLNERWKTLYALFSKIIASNNLSDDFNVALENRIALGIIGQGLNECKSPRNTANKIKKIKQILTSDQYRNAIMNLQLKYFPIHWKLFFGAAKKNNAFVLYFLLVIIMKLK